MKQAAAMLPFLVAWRHAIASTEGPTSSVDRHVGLTLALYMNSSGLSVWPNQDTVARRTALTDRTVCRALKRLCDEQWLDRQKRQARDRHGRTIKNSKRHERWGYEYRARLPLALANAYVNGERRSLFTGKENGESDDISMANAVRTNTAVEYITQGSAYRKEGITLATPAAREVQKRRAARDELVAEIELAEAREKMPDAADRNELPAPASPARRGNVQEQSEAEQPQPASSPDKQAATLEPQPRPQPAPAVVMSEGVVKMRLINRLTADGFLTVESTTPRVSRLIKGKGVGFAVDAEQQLEQRGLSGQAASLYLDELAGITREHAERRLDEHLALRIRQHQGNGAYKEAKDVMTLRARSLARMREDDHLTWGEIWSIYERLSEDETMRRQLLIPGVLRHHWRTQLEAERASVSAEAAT